MPKFAANLTMMFNEVPFMERFGAAGREGFRGVEFLLPYDFPAAGIRAQLEENNQELAMFNLPAGNWAAGERGIACLPGREQEFRDGVELGIRYAEELGVKKLHAMAGIRPADVDAAQAQETYLANIAYAAKKLAEHNIVLLLEAINTRDIPNFFLNTQAQGHSVIEQVGASNIMLQIDIYHTQITEGDITAKLRKYMPVCGHVQIAGNPARNEPDAGEVNYPYIFELLDELGYAGWVGCEYRPKADTASGLGWFRATQSSAQRENTKGV